MRPVDCKDRVSAENLHTQGIVIDENAMEIKGGYFLLTLYNGTVRVILPRHFVRQMAAWALEDQTKDMGNQE